MSVNRADYETEVRNLGTLAAELRSRNLEPEAIARAMHSARQKLAMRFKALTSEPTRSLISERTLHTYGDNAGPSIGFLRARGKSWEQITESASRPGRLPTQEDHHCEHRRELTRLK